MTTSVNSSSDLLKETIKHVAAQYIEIKDIREDINESIKGAAKTLDMPVPLLRKACVAHYKSNITEQEEETREIREILSSIN